MNTDPAVSKALSRGGTIDITTTGRKTGLARRIEIWMTNLDGELYITGFPGRRGWLANVNADPHLTLHLKRGVQADLPAIAEPITEPGQRETVLRRIFASWRWDEAKVERRVARWVADSPLIRVRIEA